MGDKIRPGRTSYFGDSTRKSGMNDYLNPNTIRLSLNCQYQHTHNFNVTG